MKKKFGIVLGVALVAVMLVAVLAACVPSDPAKAESNLKGEEYRTAKIDGLLAQAAVAPFTALASVDLGSVDSVVTGAKGTDTIVLIYFKDTNNAKEYYSKLDEAMKKLSDEEREKKGEYGRAGSAVFLGTKAAVKAVK